jgi:hypothetical protein
VRTLCILRGFAPIGLPAPVLLLTASYQAGKSDQGQGRTVHMYKT